MNPAINAPSTTFSLTDEDAARIADLREALGRDGHLVNRSEVVRLGLLALQDAAPNRRAKLLRTLPRRKPGRNVLPP